MFFRVTAKLLCLVVGSLIAVSPAVVAQPPVDTVPAIRHVMIEPATAQVPRSDTASVAELADGRLMVVYQKYEAREEGGRDQGFASIWSKTSADGGLTWEEPRLLVDVAPGDVSTLMPAITRLRNGELVLICQRVHKPYGSATTMLLFRSTDDGQTFVEESPVWERREDFPIQGGATSLVELSTGRLVIPYHTSDAKKHLAFWCHLSDDGGKTWRPSRGGVDLPERGAMEGSIAELDEGTLVMSLRTQLGGPYIARSTDGGETWSKAVFSGLAGGEACTCLRRLPGTNHLVLFWNNSKFIKKHHHRGERSPLSAALSTDGGTTWQKIGDIANEENVEYTNLDCLFPASGDAYLTYMHAKPAWNRKQIDLKGAVIPRGWFAGE